MLLIIQYFLFTNIYYFHSSLLQKQFNCLKENHCYNFGSCNKIPNKCDCPNGFGSPNCSIPTCGGLTRSERPLRSGQTCRCDKGWEGINCNMCIDDDVCNSLMPHGIEGGRCYKGSYFESEKYFQCNVTNKEIVKSLDKKYPGATINCNKQKDECMFQFWTLENQSFGCKFNKCDFKNNTIDYNCKQVKCECIPGTMLCGLDGSIDISEFLQYEIKGPAKLNCNDKNECIFSEPGLDDLIKSIFGDEYITLQCKTAECMHKSQIPNKLKKNKGRDYKLIVSIVSSLIIVLGLLFLVYWLSDAKYISGNCSTQNFETSPLQTNKTPLNIMFKDIHYSLVDNTNVIQNLDGICKSGEITAIMGPSGAGKTTLLNILAMKNKTGKVGGEIYINNNKINNSNRKIDNIVGYVYQEDLLMPTLTVFETVMISAMLRLSTKISTKTKETKVLDILDQLSILSIKDKFIGDSNSRGISGGERKRVCIACELVTSPSILFLDEPTTGLDSYNALRVAEILKSLAKNLKTTIVMTIHQPRSNIYSLFDSLILLNKGMSIYSGETGNRLTEFLSSINLECPSGYNMADYLIDISHSVDMPNTADSEGDSLLQNTNGSRTSDKFHNSKYRQLLHEEMKTLLNQEYTDDIDQNSTYVEDFGLQFKVLSYRSLKNLYRNPALLLTNYISSVVVGLLCGSLFYKVTNDIAGFQNRMGVFFFICTLYGFGNLTSLQTFENEKLIFKKERANSYYSTLPYFLSKIMFDLVLLKTVPPLLLGAVLYPLVGLNVSFVAFLKFAISIVLFNVTSGASCLFIGIAVNNTSVATFVASLSILFSMLFGGLILNKNHLSTKLRWLFNLSYFNFAMEALIINEMKHLQLKEKKYGLEIDVPGAVILSTFGFDAAAYSIDIAKLTTMFILLLALSYAWLRKFVRQSL